MLKPKVINGVSFYPASVENKTEAQFIKENKGLGFSDEQLKSAYATLTKKESAKAIADKETDGK